MFDKGLNIVPLLCAFVSQWLNCGARQEAPGSKDVMKRVLWGTAFCLLVCFSVLAEQKYSLSGTVIFDEGDRIFISLYDREEFRDFKRKPLPPEPFTLAIEPSVQEKQAGKVPFKFENIPSGTYALLAFRDQNRTGSSLRPDRIASSYRMMNFSGRWDEVKFRLDRNITGVTIDFVPDDSPRKTKQ